MCFVQRKILRVLLRLAGNDLVKHCNCLLFFLLFFSVPLLLSASETLAQQNEVVAESAPAKSSSREQPRIIAIRTESPRETLSTFVRLTQQLESALGAYQVNKSWDLSRRVDVIVDQFIALIDMSKVSRASRREVGLDTTGYLLDIFGRIELPPIESVPSLDSFDEGKIGASWRIPQTPIRISQLEAGSREGEFLFNARTLISAPRFYRGIEDLPLTSTLAIQSWRASLHQMTGPLVPEFFVAVMPSGLKKLWLDTPIWKILITLLMFAVALLSILWLFKKTHENVEQTRLASSGYALLPPIMTMLIAIFLGPLISNQINISGRFSAFTDIILVTAFFLSLAWVTWVAIIAAFEWVISSPRISDESLDANLLRLTARIIGILVVILILAFGAQDLGLPVFSLLAGLGIGGLAIALAIRPTLENLIGGFIIFIDKPVRLGDFCNFGSYTGTVERIGVRSTEIRALDRTIISIPNAKFADMEIVNWAQCDQMLINATIGLRYETTPDQLRYVLAKMREMFHAHPRIANDTVRVRFSGYGASSLDITIRVYADTREWNDFHAIKEDVFMRLNDIVSDSGTGFAFPSQTLYMGNDDGLDKDRTEAADKEVKSWRRRGRLPFPRMSVEQIKKIEDTLDYPPKGSIELSADSSADYEHEGLSSEETNEEQPLPDSEIKTEKI